MNRKLAYQPNPQVYVNWAAGRGFGSVGFDCEVRGKPEQGEEEASARGNGG